MAENIKVEVTPTSLEISPGETAQVTITVRNASNVVDVFPVEVQGVDPSWYQLTIGQVGLLPNDQTTGTLTIKPPKASTCVAGAYPLTVKASSQRNPAQQTTVSIALELKPFYSFALDMRPQRATGPRGFYDVTIANQGNTEIRFDLAGRDPEELCRFEFQDRSPIVPAGESREVAMMVDPRQRPLMGRPRPYSFNVTASPYPPVGEPALAPGQLQATARLPNAFGRIGATLSRRPRPAAYRSQSVADWVRTRGEDSAATPGAGRRVPVWAWLAGVAAVLVVVVVVVLLVVVLPGDRADFQAHFMDRNRLNPGQEVTFGPFVLPHARPVELRATADWSGAAEFLEVSLIRPDGSVDGPFRAVRSDRTVEFVIDDEQERLGLEGWKINVKNPSPDGQATGTLSGRYIELP